MKLTVRRKTLLDTVAALLPACARGRVKPELACVLIDAGEAGAKASATDLEVWASRPLPGPVVGRPGLALASAERLAAALKAIPDGDITLEAGPDQLALAWDDGEICLPVHDADKFPSCPETGEGRGWAVDGEDLARLIRLTGWAPSLANSGRYAACGLLLRAAGGRLTAVGTDLRRLALAEAPLHAGGADASAVIPAKALRLIAEGARFGGTAMARVAPNEAAFDFADGSSVYARQLEGQFPPVDQIRDLCRKPPTASGLGAAGELLGCLQAAAVVASEDTRVGEFRLGGGTLAVRLVAGPDRGRSAVSVPLAAPEGEGRSLFDPSFPAEWLRSLDPGETLRVALFAGKFFTLEAEASASWFAMAAASEPKAVAPAGAPA